MWEVIKETTRLKFPFLIMRNGHSEDVVTRRQKEKLTLSDYRSYHGEMAAQQRRSKGYEKGYVSYWFRSCSENRSLAAHVTGKELETLHSKFRNFKERVVQSGIHYMGKGT